MLEDGEAVRRGLGRRAHRLHLGEEDAEQPERVHAPERARRVGKGEHQEQLVPHALGGDRGQRRRDRPDRRDRPPRQPEAERRLQAHAAERAQGVVGEHAEVRCPQTARAEIGEASGGIHDRRAAPDEQLAQRNREGVDGEVAGREVRRERGAAEVADVEADAREYHTPRPALGVEGDEGAAKPLRHPPREVERPRRDRDVEVDLAPRPTSEPGVTRRPAHEPGGGAPATREGGDRPHDRDLGARQPLALKNGHGRVSTLLTHDSSRRTAVALKLRKVDYTKRTASLDLLITGRWFDAKEAYRINFVSRVVKRARLLDECTKLAERICEYPQSSLRTDKEACIRGLGLHAGGRAAAREHALEHEPLAARHARRTEGVHREAEVRPDAGGLTGRRVAEGARRLDGPTSRDRSRRSGNPRSRRTWRSPDA